MQKSNEQLILNGINRLHDRIDVIEGEVRKLKVAVVGDETHEGMVNKFRNISRLRRAAIFIASTALSSIALAKAEKYFDAPAASASPVDRVVSQMIQASEK